ncbi:hypothetical protein HPB50_028084 [Hyalomma asiaticum]|nr:hypothetical protein HPB50_028084 [Hyalomma asiaticum]
MQRNDCSFVYTSAESVGLGMDMQRHERRTLCNLWGWLVRLFYVSYLATRCAHYFGFIAEHGCGRAELAGMLLLDLNFLLAAVVNYRLSVDGHLIRNAVSIFPQATPGNPRFFFANVLAVVALIVWGVAIFSSVYQHEHVKADSSVERSFLVLSYYVNGIFVFGTFCFSMALFNYIVYCICYALQDYRKKVSTLFARPAKPTVMNLVLRDFCALGGLIRDVSAAFRIVVLVWFVAGAVYAVEVAVRWVFADGAPSSLAPSVLRVGAITSLLFLSSDVAARLHRQAIGIRASMVAALDSSGIEGDRDSYVVIDRFASECLPEDVPAVRLLRRWCFGRSTFLTWLIVAVAISGSAAAVSYYAAN